MYVELLELLELYCELLLARFGLLEQKYVSLSKRQYGFNDSNVRSTREPDPGVSEGVCAIIHAAPRTELKGRRRPRLLLVFVLTSHRSTELHVLRDILMHKFGREFAVAVMANRDGMVSERVSVARPTSHANPGC